MKRILTIISAGVLLATLALGEKTPQYTIIDLGTLGGKYSYAYGINNPGVVAGGAATASQAGGVFQTGFIWYGGLIINTGTLGGAACPECNSEAGGPNANGVSAVVSETAAADPNGEDFCGFGTHRQCLGATWKAGVLKPLATLPGGHNAQPYWLNNRDQIVGFSENGHSNPAGACAMPFQVFDFEAVVWGPDGKIQKQLPPLAGDTVAFAFGNNENGLVVGASGTCATVTLPPNFPPNAPHAVLWDKDGTATELRTAGAVNNVATSVNNRGDVVGNAQFADGSVGAFLWHKGAGDPQALGTLSGDFVSVAPCCGTINNSGEVVGFSIPGPQGNGRAFIWRNDQMTDLNDLIAAGSPWYLLSAQSINDAGEIVGTGTINGEMHAFLATPR